MIVLRSVSKVGSNSLKCLLLGQASLHEAEEKRKVISGLLPSDRPPVQLFTLFNIKKRNLKVTGNFIEFILKSLTKFEKLIHTESMSIF